MALFNNNTDGSILGSLAHDEATTQTNTTEEDSVTDRDMLITLGSNVDAMFLVIMGSIIIFMQAGFGFLEAGSIRAKNTTNILIKNFADLTFGTYTISYFLVSNTLSNTKYNSLNRTVAVPHVTL